MNQNIWPASGLVLALVLVGMGCENTALLGRRDIDRGGGYDRGREYDRGRDSRDSARDEMVGTVERVDRGDREIHLRTSEARTAVIRYDSGTIVQHRGRDFRVEDLRSGDLVLVQVRRDSRGDRYADLIRLRDRDDVGIR
jgi:hypothetical protein